MNTARECTRRQPARAVLALFAACALALAACGGGNGSDSGDSTPHVTPPVAAPLGDPVTGAVGPAGGSIEFTASGVAGSLTIAAGALAADTAITVTPVAPGNDEWARLRIEGPSGVLETPATLTLQLSETAGPAATGVVVEAFGVLPLPTTAGADGRSLVIELQDFGADAAAPASASGRMHAMAARPLASTPPASPPVAARKALTPQERRDALRKSIERHELEVSVRSGLSANLAAASVLQLIGDPQYAADALRDIAQASDKACTALRNALAVAEFFPVPADMNANDPNESQRLIFNVIGPVLYWQAVVMQLGADPCPGASVDSVLSAKYAELLNWVKGKKATQQDGTGFGQIVKPAAQAAQLASHAKILKAPQLARAVDTAFVEPAMVPLRSIAWDAAAASQAHYQPVFSQLNAYAGPMREDVQLAGTTLQVGSYGDAAATQVEGQATIGRKATPEASIKAWTVSAKTGGKVGLEGPIQVLKCPLPANERLVVEFEGAEVLSRASAGDLLLQGTLSFEINRLLDAAGIQPANATQHVLRLWRKGSGCNASFGLGDATVAEITLDFSKTCRAAPGTTHCVTVVNGDNGAPVVGWQLVDGAEDGTLLLRSTTPPVAGLGFYAETALWKAGRLTRLPADFWGTAMSSSGTVAGLRWAAVFFGQEEGLPDRWAAFWRAGTVTTVGPKDSLFLDINDSDLMVGQYRQVVAGVGAYFPALRSNGGAAPELAVNQNSTLRAVNNAGVVCMDNAVLYAPQLPQCIWINDHGRWDISTGRGKLVMNSGAERTGRNWERAGPRHAIAQAADEVSIIDMATNEELPLPVLDPLGLIRQDELALNRLAFAKVDTRGRMAVELSGGRLAVLTPNGVDKR